MPDLIDMQRLNLIVPHFNGWIQNEGRRWVEERVEKNSFLQTHFNEQSLHHLDEGILRGLIQRLWAFRGWTNQDYLLEEMTKSGMENIKEGFGVLLHGAQPLSNRFEHAKQRIRMMGAAALSEILVHFGREEYAVWNRRAKKGLVSLGFPEANLPKSSQISGLQYVSFCQHAKTVLAEVKSLHPGIRDLLELDFLLYYISMLEDRKEAGVAISPKDSADDFDHDETINQLLELGDGLGFEVEKEFLVTHGCRIDALWRSRVANLGMISYAFEVHRRGSRDSAILNLQRILRQDPSIQKVVLVSSRLEIEAFQREISSLGEDFRNAVGYFDVDDLHLVLNHLSSMKDILRNIGLLGFDRVRG